MRLITCAWLFLVWCCYFCTAQDPNDYSTYIEPSYPPNGEFSFDSHGEFYTPMGAVLACCAIIIGIYYASFGYRLLKLSLAGAAFILFFSAIFLGIGGAYPDWWILAMLSGIIVGLIAAVGLSFAEPFLFCVLGFLCGFLMVAQFVGSFVVLMWSPSYFPLVLWSTSLLGGGFYALLSVFIASKNGQPQKHSLMANTSILGGYLYVVGIDFFSEDRYAAIVAEMFKGDVVFVDPWPVSLSFMMIWVLVSVFGFGLQSMLISSRTFHYLPAHRLAPLDDSSFDKF